MPTYQYACTACGEQLEAVQKFSDDPLTECPACQGKLRKVFSAVGIVFKGSGFYRTDSRSSGSSSTTTSGTTTATKSSDSGDSGGSGGSGTKEPAASTSAPGGSSSSTSTAGSTAAA